MNFYHSWVCFAPAAICHKAVHFCAPPTLRRAPVLQYANRHPPYLEQIIKLNCRILFERFCKCHLRVRSSFLKQVGQKRRWYYRTQIAHRKRSANKLRKSGTLLIHSCLACNFPCHVQSSQYASQPLLSVPMMQPISQGLHCAALAML